MKSFISYFGKDAPVVFASIVAALTVLIIVLMPNQARAQSGSVYSYGQTTQSVSYGVVLGLREVQVAKTDNAMSGVNPGTVVGATLGGLAGSALGRTSNWQGQAALTTIGATLGGLAGKRVSDAPTVQPAVEVLVQTGTPQQPQVTAVVQPYPGPTLAVGQRVAVLGSGTQVRVIPVYIEPASAQPSPAVVPAPVVSPPLVKLTAWRG